MAYYTDLSPCDYFGVESSSFLTTIGWLERGEQFTTGCSPGDVYVRLGEMLRDPWQPMIAGGFHECNLCIFEGTHGTKNLFVPGKGTIYVSPELITHYMNAHGYLPPEEFCDAVLACPPMKSINYFKSLLKNGARTLISSDVSVE